MIGLIIYVYFFICATKVKYCIMIGSFVLSIVFLLEDFSRLFYFLTSGFLLCPCGRKNFGNAFVQQHLHADITEASVAWMNVLAVRRRKTISESCLYFLLLFCDFHHSYVFFSLFTPGLPTITTNLPGQRNRLPSTEGNF